ncbi:MAG TPA: CopD family protein [Streptosporangiaceae bacterium]|nr:CopD family protein [Streptosporangiaceae bacterium]
MASTSSRYQVLQRTIALPPPGRKRAMVLFIVATVLTGVVALAVGMWLGGNLTQSQINGIAIGGTGGLTGWGLPTSKMVMDVASVGVIGMLVACVLLPSREPAAEPGAMVRRLLRTASWLALVWAIANAALLIFSWSDLVGQPVTDLPFANLFTDPIGAFPAAADYTSSTSLAIVIAAGVAVTRTRGGALILLPLAAYNLVPMALQGHANHSTLLRYSLITHVIAISLWVGGLAALFMHVRKQPALLAVAAPRFSTLALFCYVAVGVSGVIAAWDLIGSIPSFWGSRYGVLVLFKIAALIALGIFGWWHRRHTIHRIRANQETHAPRARRAFTQLAAAEIAIMVAAVAIAVALSRSASPDTILLHSNRQAAAPVQYSEPVARG